MKYIVFFLLFVTLSQFSFSQNGISGIVCSYNAEPLPYVNIYNKAERRGTTTDSSGSYYLNIVGKLKLDSVRFSYIGYKAVEISINDLIKMDTVFLSPLIEELESVEIVGFGSPPYTIITEAMKRIPENFYSKERVFYAYYKEKLKEIDGKIVQGRTLEAALKISEPAYLKHYSMLKENSCILAIRKSDDTLFHGVFEINYLSYTLQQNIARYFGKYGFDTMSKLRKNWILKKEEVFRADSNEFIYKISFKPIDTTVWGETGFFWISSNNFKIYRFEIDVNKGVYNNNTYRDSYKGYYNYVPYKVIVNYNETKEGLALSYIKFYEGIEIKSIDMNVKSYFLVDCELKVVSEGKNLLDNFPCKQVHRNEDLYKQKENDNPEFWLNFNITN